MTLYPLEALFRLFPLYALPSIGGLLSERSGVAAFCLEGLLISGALGAVLAVDVTGSPLIGVLAGGAVGVLLASVHAYLSLHARVNHFVSAIVINFLALAGTSLVLSVVYGRSGATDPLPVSLASARYSLLAIGCLVVVSGLIAFAIKARARTPSSIVFFRRIGKWTGVLGAVALVVGLFVPEIPVFPCVTTLVSLALFVGLVWFMRSTQWGMWVTASGESEFSALSAGIPVVQVRWACVLICGGLAGLAGAYLSTCLVDLFRTEMTGGRGYLVIAAIVIGRWKPWPTFVAAAVLAGLEGLQSQWQLSSWWPHQVGYILPYLVVLGSLVLLRQRVHVPAELLR